jgi:signal transduction histidine kinase
MAALTHPSGPRSWLHLPGRTIRARLTWLYGSLFLGSGAVLLVVTGLLWEHATGPVTVTAKAPVPNRILHVTGLVATNSLGAPQGQVAGGSASVFRKGQRAQFVVGQLRALVTEKQSSDLHNLLLYSAVALAIMGLLAILLGHFAAGRALRPLRDMTSTAKEISATNLHRRIGMDGPADDLKSLGDTIDELLGRLERSFESQRRFVANASHELRTPLATMRAMLDVAVFKPEPPPPETTRLAERMRAELDRTDGLVDSFLTLARAEGNALDADERVDLDELVDGALRAHAGAIERAAIAVSHHGEPGAVVEGHRALLTRMVSNLVDNAVRHNRRGGWLALGVATDGAVARLVVENSGAVLDGETVAQLVQPFRRAVADRTAAGGYGLGLSIVSSIAQTHGGSLRLEGLEAGGLRVVVELPVLVPEPAGVGG